VLDRAGPHDQDDRLALISKSEDEEALARLGYAQQLLRDMGGFSSFALSFSVISILTGAVTLYSNGLAWGGPLVMTLGWPLVTVLTLAIAASLAELASAYPTAGALYHWSATLGGKGWGFATAWLNTIGQLAITAGVDYGLATFLAPMLHLPDTAAVRLALCAALLVSHATLNHVGVRVVSLLNSLSAWYHLAATIVLIAALAAFAPKQPASFLVARATDRPEGYAYGFAIGLLQAAWTFTGYDASAHVTEETRDPTRNAPWGIFLSVAVSGVFGYLLLLVVTLAIGDLHGTLAAANPFVAVLEGALGTFGRALVWICMGAMWFCGLASVTSNSRMLFAFARDGGLPASRRLASVSTRWRTPHVAVWTSAAAAFAIALWSKALSAMTALSVIALYFSYAAPIALGLAARARRRRGPWDLGRWSPATNAVALVWVVVIATIMVLPPNGLAGLTFLGCAVAIAAGWFGWMRTRFKGPPALL
jgi:amino acid transporter